MLKPIHEYALLGGRNRASIGRLISSIAAAVSGVATFVILAADDVAKQFGWNHNVPPLVMSLAGAGAVYAGLYWLFDQHVWKLELVRAWLRVPCIAGKWKVAGETLNQDKSVRFTWDADMTIQQSWDRIRVHLKTRQSGSFSISAALVHDVEGPLLMYNYQNEPNIDERELAVHRGFAELKFSDDLQTARGEYFNGQGRLTFGTMNLTRV